MKETVYLETSVISYYTSRPSRDIIVLAHQELTREWWTGAMERYNIFISQAVIDEIMMGDIEASGRRLEAIKNFPNLDLTYYILEIAQEYIKVLEIPLKSSVDALHIAIASVHNIDYLVTWNCNHIANGEMIKKLIKINDRIEISTPFICTPEVLMKEEF